MQENVHVICDLPVLDIVVFMHILILIVKNEIKIEIKKLMSITTHLDTRTLEIINTFHC